MLTIRRLSGQFHGKLIVVFLTMDNIDNWLFLNYKTVRDPHEKR